MNIIFQNNINKEEFNEPRKINMNEMPEITLKTVCCTCLSVDRKLTKLCRVNDGVNNLFFLLSYNFDAYEAIFNKGAAHFSICWECEALMGRLCEFRNRACLAQKHLAGHISGWTCIKLPNSLSTLKYYQNKNYYEFVENELIPDNFIDCGPDISFIKTESDTDDTPLANLFIKDIKPLLSNEEIKKSPGCEEEKVYILDKKTKKNKEIRYSTFEMTEEEMLEHRRTLKLEDRYLNTSSKCESCVFVFKDSNHLENHNLELHVEKPKHKQCDICLTYIKQKYIEEHKRSHYIKYVCYVCDNVAYTIENIETHWKDLHVRSEFKNVNKKRLDSPKGVAAIKDKWTPTRYLCKECDKSFDTQNKKYKHIQKCHREGFKCSTCGKSFAFKNTLNRHEQLHAGPLPREQCPTCGKLIRQDLVKVHAHTHTHRQSYVCVSCDKRFVSRASYENHLKNAKPHTVKDVLKYKCSECSKGYRSRGELRDHVNYQHIRRTMHKCPICNKALATRRCITRHVRRAHHGIKENTKDKICQTCGKAFRDKKCLREHEWIHSGERPFSCATCGRAFRQRASLYTHRRRVHRDPPSRDTQAPLLHHDDTAAEAHSTSL